jgi:subtilisin family serine protease
MLTVGSISATKALSSFSNYGTPVQLYTYGENIISTLPGNKVGVASGTSFAAPQVTGSAAILATYQVSKGKCYFSPSQITNGFKSNGDSFTGQTGKIVNFEKTFKKMFSSLENDNNEGGASIDLNQTNTSDRSVSLSASPNPFNTDLNINIKLPEGVSKATLSLIDSRGMLLQQQDLTLNNQDNLNWVTNDAPIGLYFLRVQADNGEVQTIKLIKN